MWVETIRQFQYADGSVKSEVFKYHDICPTDEPGPNTIEYYQNGVKKSEEYWDENGKRHHYLDPAYIEYYDDGSIKSKSYYIHGELYRLNKPARVIYREDGTTYSEKYYRYGKLHRLDGPAYVVYGKGGNPLLIRYMWDGDYSVNDAQSFYDSLLRDGHIDEETYFLYSI